MSEEKIKEKVNRAINRLKEITDDEWFFEMDKQCLEALQGLLDLYNKEKEKNKKIKDGILFVGRRNGKDAEQKMILDEYIRKDKIKEILKKDRDCMSLGYYSAYIGLIDDIQELLYEE